MRVAHKIIGKSEWRFKKFENHSSYDMVLATTNIFTVPEIAYLICICLPQRLCHHPTEKLTITNRLSGDGIINSYFNVNKIV